MQVLALHGHDDVEVDLQVVRDAPLDAEGVRRVPDEPARELCKSEPCADKGQRYGPDASIASRRQVRLLGFG